MAPTFQSISRALYAVGLCLIASHAAAQNFPTKPIRIVVPYPAGGTLDFVARTIGDRLSKSVGQPVIIDNKTGASGAIGTADVAKAEPDGHTVLFTANDTLINNVALFKSLPYNPQKDFAFISQIVRSPTLLSATPVLGVKTLDDVKKLASAGTNLSYGSWGQGGLGHIAGETLNQELRANMVHVPLRGEGPVLQDLMSNTLSLGLSSVGTGIPFVLSGKIVPLAVMTRDRVPGLPNVPTMRELGYKDPIFQTSIWLAAVAPAKCPPAVVQKLANEIRAIASSPEVTKMFAEHSLEVVASTPEQFQASYRQEFDSTIRRMRALGIQPQ